MDKPHTSPYTLYHFFRERFVLPVRQWLFRVIRLMLVIFIVASVVNFVFSYFFHTPKMHRLREENEAVIRQYRFLESRIQATLSELSGVRKRDQEIYRSIFSADTLNLPGIYTPYPAERYLFPGYGRYAPLLASTWERLDALGRQLYLQSVSLDQLEQLALDKDLMAEVVPAIMPVDKRRVRGHIGAFGGRVNPVTRRYAMHEGIDLAGPIDTPIYATGTGIVESQASAKTGYGIQVVIDHGFGYKTRYAHLSKVLVRPGQVVRRGEQIAEMGNTGRSSGPHLHYEVIYRGKPVDPINYISRDMSEEEFRAITESARATTYEVDE